MDLKKEQAEAPKTPWHPETGLIARMVADRIPAGQFSNVMEAVAARCPKSGWHPETKLIAGMVVDHVPADKFPRVLESFQIARTSRCLQPPGDARAVARLAQLWEEISGTKAQGNLNLLKYLLGGGAGLIAGLIIGYGLQTVMPGVPPMVVALLGAVIGAGAAHFVRGTKTFEDCMLKLIINERRSVVRKAMVTDQCELWVPKGLLWHRQKEWRRDRKGITYMWVMLPYRERILRRIRNMIDGLALVLDLHVMLDSAGKGQRVWNRRLKKNAEEFAHLDDGEEPPKRLEEIMPHVLGAGQVIAGFIIVVVVAQ